MKVLKFFSYLSVSFLVIPLILLIMGWINLINGINPMIFGISFLSLTTSLILVKEDQNKIKWVSLSLAVLGFLILSLSTFKILEMKDFWPLGMIPLSLAILIGLFYQIKLVTNPKGKFFIVGRLMTSFLCGFLILVGLQIDDPKIYLAGKVVLLIFTFYMLIGSLLKPTTID